MKTIKLGLAALLLLSTAVLAEGRAALVIGNAAYAYAPRALSAERDVEAVADALGAAGYDVTFGLDLDRREMRAVMDQFAANIDQADEIVIYYSGHAVRMSGRTFLAPTDFNPVGPVSVAMDSAPLAALEAMLASKPGAAVLFLDAAQRAGSPLGHSLSPALRPSRPQKAHWLCLRPSQAAPSFAAAGG